MDTATTHRPTVTVRMFRDGSTQWPVSSMDARWTDEKEGASLLLFNRRKNEHVLVSVVETEDVERAIKVTNERRIQMIANGEWPKE